MATINDEIDTWLAADLPGEPSGFRHRMRSKPGIGHAWRSGVFLAGLNALTQLMFLRAYPAWSIAIMVVDGLIIYALIAHAEEVE